MRTSHYRRLARQVQEQSTTLLCRAFQPCDYSQRCTAWVLLSSLVLAAANRLSLAAVAALRPRSPSRETLRKALHATLPDYPELRRRLGELCRASLPRSLRQRRRAGPRRRYPMAIDLHQVRYFKRQRTPPPHVRKGKYQPGTAYAHHYATASLLRKGQYFIVAVTPYDPGEDLAALVRRLLQEAAAHGFSPRYLLMDRGFWSSAVFRYLQQARYPFLIPVLARGKKATLDSPPTGTRIFFHGRMTGWYSYRVGQRRGEQKATVTIVVQRRNQRGRKGKHGRYAWVYALWHMDLSSIAWVHQSYRRRFRIESSYRLLEEARGRTSTRDEAWRLWYVLLAVVLVNVWLALRRTAGRGRGTDAREYPWWNRVLIALTWMLLQETTQPRNDRNPQLQP
jgi:putative transposase